LLQVRVEGEGMKQLELSLKDLTTKFKKHTVTATLQCTGNRRDMFNDIKKVKGLEWGIGEATCCHQTKNRHDIIPPPTPPGGIPLGTDFT